MLRKIIFCSCAGVWLTFGLHAESQSPGVFNSYQGSTVFTNEPAKDPDEPNICGIPGGASVWYQYKSPADGVLFVNTDGSKFDTLLGVFVDNGLNQGYRSLIQLACDDNSGANGLTSSLRTPVTNGVTYYLMVDGKNGAYGVLHLSYLLDRKPSISVIPTQAIYEDQTVGPINFTISDFETVSSNLAVLGASSDQALVPNSAITFGGAGSNRTITVTPTPYHYGTNTIGIWVYDSAGNATYSSFTLAVAKTNHAPRATTNSFTRMAGRPITIPISSLLQGASDSDGDSLSITNVSTWSLFGNAAIVSGTVAISYCPPSLYNSLDRFNYTITDGHGGMASGTVNILVDTHLTNAPGAPF